MNNLNNVLLREFVSTKKLPAVSLSGVSKTQLRTAIIAGKIPSLTFEGQTYVHISDLNSFQPARRGRPSAVPA